MAYENILVETRGKVGVIRLQPAAGAERAQRQDLGRTERRDRRASRPMPGSAASSSPARTRPSPPAPTSRRWPASPTWICFSAISPPAGTRLARARKPVIAAVAGFALGGGCELAMHVRPHHRRRQREIRPAGDQARRHSRHRRHAAADRAVGKSKAMDMMLTGRMMDAQEAERSGLVARVVPLGRSDG